MRKGNKIFIIIVIAALLIGAAAGITVFLLKKKKGVKSTDTTDTTSSTTADITTVTRKRVSSSIVYPAPGDTTFHFELASTVIQPFAIWKFSSKSSADAGETIIPGTVTTGAENNPIKGVVSVSFDAVPNKEFTIDSVGSTYRKDKAMYNLVLNNTVSSDIQIPIGQTVVAKFKHAKT